MHRRLSHATSALRPRSKSNMAHPTKQWGFWRADKHTSKYELNADPAVAKLPGRRNPNPVE